MIYKIKQSLLVFEDVRIRENNMAKDRKPIDRSLVQKKLIKTIAAMLPIFSILPYADQDPDPKKSARLTIHPLLNPKLDPVKYACISSFAFFTPNEDPGTYGNTISDKFMTHQRDASAVSQLARYIKKAGMAIAAYIIDSPNIKLSQLNIPNYALNTEGEFAANGTFFRNNLLDTYETSGIWWDMETDSTDYVTIAKLMKKCFLEGIRRDPNYLFGFVTYGDRAIDQILNMTIDKDGDEVDQELHELGFECFSDLITKRGNFSRIITMSYNGTAQELFDEGDVYALKYLAKGDASKLYEMRKFVAIGVTPLLTDPGVAKTVAAGCDPTKLEGFGQFMVWDGNRPPGLDMFTSMVDARTQPLPKELDMPEKVAAEREKKLPAITKKSGNRPDFLAYFIRMFGHKLQATQPSAKDNPKKPLLEENVEENVEESLCGECCGVFTKYVNQCLLFFSKDPSHKNPVHEDSVTLKL